MGKKRVRKRRFKKDRGKLGQGMGALKRGNCVLPKSLGSTSEGSKISLSQALGWVSDISIEGLAVGKETSFSFNL